MKTKTKTSLQKFHTKQPEYEGISSSLRKDLDVSRKKLAEKQKVNATLLATMESHDAGRRKKLGAGSWK